MKNQPIFTKKKSLIKSELLMLVILKSTTKKFKKIKIKIHSAG